VAEAKVFTFTYQELAEMMVRKLGLSEGLWGVFVRFGLQAANVGPGPEDLRPAAILPVLEIGLQRLDDPSNLAVDAAEVTTNGPASRKSKTRASMDFRPGQRVKVVQRGTAKVGGVTLTDNVLEGATIVRKNPDGTYQVSLKGLIEVPGAEEVTMPADWIQPL
jgi:hypothetical protein